MGEGGCPGWNRKMEKVILYPFFNCFPFVANWRRGGMQAQDESLEIENKKKSKKKNTHTKKIDCYDRTETRRKTKGKRKRFHKTRRKDTQAEGEGMQQKRKLREGGTKKGQKMRKTGSRE